MARALIYPIKSKPAQDVYRFGDGPELVLKPGTMGWSASEIEDPALRSLWDAGRYEILDGVLTVMPAALFIGGESAETLAYLLRNYLKERKIPAAFSTEVLGLPPQEVWGQ